MTRRITKVSVTATLAVVGGLLVAPTAAASPAAPSDPKPPGHQAAGKKAFTKSLVTSHPSPHKRKKAVKNARKAVGKHKSKAHLVKGQKLKPTNVSVNKKTGAAHVRFDSTYKGLPVYGGDLIVHLKPNGSYKSVETANRAKVKVSTSPSVAARYAKATSRKRLHGHVTSVSKPHLAVWDSGRSAELVWETVVKGIRKNQTPSRLHVLIDAHKGTLVAQRDEVHTLLTAAEQRAATRAQTRQAKTDGAKALTQGTGRTLYSGTVPLDLTRSGGTWTMRDPSHGNGYTTNLNHRTSGTGTIYQNSTGTFGNGTVSDPASAGADAHYGAAMTYDYYTDVHGWNGIFNDGRGVPSRTHYGNAYVNAFWDGRQMTYGDGQNNQRPLVEIDVAGHEMSHGVSAQLTGGWGEPQGSETGGLNEATSDIFGTMVEFYADNSVDTPDYTMGELINIYGNGRPLRYLYNPSLDGNSPNCWYSGIGGLDAHYSGGPLNHWFFLLAEGSGNTQWGTSPTCNNSTLTGIGNDKAAHIWFNALRDHSTSSEDYHAARIDSLQAAAELYGAHCAEYEAVDSAWAAVDVTGSDPVPGTCQGQPGEVSVTDPGDQTTEVGTAVNLQIQATDPDDSTLTYTATGLPAGLSIDSSTGLISGTPTTEGTSNVTVTATNTSNKSGSAEFTWTIVPQGGGNCQSPGDAVDNGGFENGTSPWDASPDIITTGYSGQVPHTGSYFAWLNGWGRPHTDHASQSVTVPSGCQATLTFWVHIDTQDQPSSAYDTLTVAIGGHTLATYSNQDAGSGYMQKSFDVSSYAGQTVTLSFTGVEDQYLATNFDIDDIAINAS